MEVETTIIVHHNGQKFGIQNNLNIPKRILDGLESDDASLLIRAAQGFAARAAEEALTKYIESREIDTFEEYPDGTIEHIYKNLNLPNILSKEST